MITSIDFENFRSFARYSISLRDLNVLVGPNNSGKSSLLDAFRLLRGAYKSAARRRMEPQQLEGIGTEWGWIIPESSVPISIANIHTDYNEEPTRVSFRFGRDKRLNLHFPREGRPLLTIETNRKLPLTSTEFRKEFPVTLAVVPTLGPFDPDEIQLDARYVEQSAQSHLAARHFRNQWLFDQKNFDALASLVEESWPGLRIERPERTDLLSGRLAMFCRENGITREVSWVGFGFQVWLQLLTQIVRSHDADVFVVDEPEIYLHPNLQRKFITLLRDHPAQIVVATHSVEIINEVEPSEIVVVDKRDRSAARLTDLSGLERVVDILGSSHNVYLTRLVRAQRVLFVEGQDVKLLARFARIAGFRDLFEAANLSITPIGGFSEYRRVAHAKWTTDEMLGEDVRMMAVFDRDYRCAEEIEAFEEQFRNQDTAVHVFARKELENYVLVPNPVERAIYARLSARVEHGNLPEIPEVSAVDLLREVTDPLKGEILSNYAAAKLRYLHASGTDMNTILHTHYQEFDEAWDNLEHRMEIVPGKDVFAALNTLVRERWGISISAGQVAGLIKTEEIPLDMMRFLRGVQEHLYGRSASQAVPLASNSRSLP